MSKKRFNKRHKLMVRWSVVTIVIAVSTAGLFVWKNSRVDPMARNEDGSVSGLTSVLERTIDQEMVTIAFEDATEPAGIFFSHFGATRNSLLPEDMGSGLAWGDYDNDGDDDLFVVNFAGDVLAGKLSSKCALYQNMGDGTFQDVSEETQTDVVLYGMAPTWADFDDDGDLDLYITVYGKNVLLRNDNGTFEDVSQRAGVDDDKFGAGASWADYDGDGDLDLYVTNYVDFTFSENDIKEAQRQYGAEVPFTLNPSSYPSQANVLYRNNGDGTFTDVAKESGVDDKEGRSLGATWFDFEGDGDLDLYVANDVSKNGVYQNNGDGTFTDIGAISLAADYRGAMGLAVGDVDTDGDDDLLVTHWVAQENALYENMLGEWGDSTRVSFMDTAEEHGLGQISLHMVGWATGLVDLDNDGLLDLWVVNGHTLEDEKNQTQLQPQEMQLFRQLAGKGFYEIGKEACASLSEAFVGRGGAHADFDNDGDMDIAVLKYGEGVLLLENQSDNAGNWLRVHLEQPPPNVFAIGATVSVRIGELTRTKQVGVDGSYLSQHQTDVQFGLGDANSIDELIVHWPDGLTTTQSGVATNQLLHLQR
ncbi:MAG: CRTAC1 family protein [Planctomycetes bacterium]|nr:CRTAC1 family protein [Planctomycetota bacterium]